MKNIGCKTFFQFFKIFYLPLTNITDQYKVLLLVGL